jgi:coniferyl-aldehyde dehydrogenase
MEAMKDEIFGPVLPIVGYRSLDEAIDRVRAGQAPLALYYFGKNDHEARKVLDGTASGGVTINDAMTQVFVEELPFGGIGASGMGSYHGKAGFVTFSHARSIYVQSGDPKAAMLFRPPFGPPVRHFIEQALFGPQNAA